MFGDLDEVNSRNPAPRKNTAILVFFAVAVLVA